MSDATSIEWTDATWNPVVGCSLESPGCTNCYAMRQAWRLEHGFGQAKYAGTTRKVKGVPVWTGVVRLDPPSLDWPIRWKGAKAARTEKRPSRIFVNSMSDLFHPDLSDADIDQVIAVAGAVDGNRSHGRRHILQVLTKRPERQRDYMANPETPFRVAAVNCKRFVGFTPHPAGVDWSAWKPWPIPSLWLGTSVEDRARKGRIDALRETPAAVRFLSLEPLLEDLGEIDLRGIHWVIVGGESGPGAREFPVNAARSIIRQCRAAAVPVLMKQVGARPIIVAPGEGWPGLLRDRKGGDPAEWPADLRVREFPALRAATHREA